MVSRYELVIETASSVRIYGRNYSLIRIVCHNSLCLYCLVAERGHESQFATTHPTHPSSLTIMKFTSWLRNITRLDSLCPNGCPRANSRMDRYSVEPRPRPFLPSHLFTRIWHRDILYDPVNLLPLQTNETRFIFLSFFFSPMLRVENNAIGERCSISSSLFGLEDWPVDY